MKAVHFGEIPPNSWDGLCDASDSAWLFHRAAWIGIEERHFGNKNLSFGLMESERLIGIQPLYATDSFERLVHCGMHRATGLALAPSLPEGLISEARSRAMERIFSEAYNARADRIQLNSHNLTPENLSNGRTEIPFWVEDYGFQLGLSFGSVGMMPAPGMATCNSDQIVALDADEEELFRRLDEACRRAVRKARANRLDFEAASRAEAVSEYYHIAQLSSQRTGEDLPARRYYDDIWSAFAPAGRCAVLFARHDGRTAGALFLLADKLSVNFLGGVSDPEYLSMRVNDFMHWSALIWAKRAGLRHYRFGPWFPSVAQDWPIARVSRFKNKFGARAFTIIQGSYFLHPEKYVVNAHDLLAALCRPRTA